MGRMLTTTQVAAEKLPYPVATLRYWRHVGFGPPSFKIGRRVLYDEDALDAWLAEEQRKQSGGDAA